LAIDESLEPDSNVTVERDPHLEKHDPPRLSTLEGMQIDESDEQSQNADCPRARAAPSRLTSRTSTRTPSSETKFRGKTPPEAGDKVQNPILPSLLYERLSIEIKSTPEVSVARAGPAESFPDLSYRIETDTLSANPFFSCPSLVGNAFFSLDQYKLSIHA
jgi:hypothetical protein